MINKPTSRLSAFFSRFFNASTFQPRKHSLGYLNAAQFLGSLNDNIYKLAMVFFLIDVLGRQNAAGILSAAGALYVIPFILFSSTAGILADRFSKQRLLVAMKIVEIAVMVLVIITFGFKIPWAAYVLLFLLATHSATFGPSKYGIIPEIVSYDKISRANGLITSFTYLAIILGTFLASFITEITDRNFIIVGSFCLLIAILGLVSALRIQSTPPKGVKKKINFLFIRQVVHTLIVIKRKKHLVISLCGSAFFLFIGSFTQLNIIPFAIQSLNLSEVAGGYLFLSTALGIALGAFLAGRALKKRIELGLSCLSCVCIALLFIFIAIFSYSLTATVILLVLIGIFGGMFIVPFDSFVQSTSPDERRGQIIATGNFLGFTGVLIASFCLYLFSEIFHLTSATGFAIIGVITGIVSLVLAALLTDYALPFVSRVFFHPLFRVKFHNEEILNKEVPKFLILQKATVKKALLLAGSVGSLEFIIPEGQKQILSKFLKPFFTTSLIPSQDKLASLLEEAKKSASEKSIPCLLLDREIPPGEYPSASQILDLFKRKNYETIFVRVEETPSGTTISFYL